MLALTSAQMHPPPTCPVTVAVDALTGDVFVSTSSLVWRIDGFNSCSGGFCAYMRVAPVVGQNASIGNPLSLSGKPALETAILLASALAVEQSSGALLIPCVGAVSPQVQLLRVDPATGVVQKLAGQGDAGTFCGDGGPVTAACVAGPSIAGISVHPDSGNVIFFDQASIRSVNAVSGVITTLVPTSLACPPLGPIIGQPATDLCLDYLDVSAGALAARGGVDSGGIAFVSASAGIVFVNSSSGAASLLFNASSMYEGLLFDGDVDFSAIAFDASSGDLYAVEQVHCNILRISAGTGAVTMAAGNGTCGPAACDDVSGACFSPPLRGGLTIAGGVLLVADAFSVIRSLALPAPVPATWEVFAGNYSCTPGVSVTVEGGDPRLACLLNPNNIAVSPVTGNVVFTDNDFGTIRVVDSTTHLLRTLASFVDGCPFSSSTCYLQSLAFDAAGSLLVFNPVQTSVWTWALYVLPTSAAVSCPVGYECPDGRPIPCSGLASYCPGNTRAPVTPAPRYAATAPVTTASGTVALTGQRLCPVGSFCVGGVEEACPPGTIGAYVGAHTASGCVKCGQGKYSPLPGRAANCLPCPFGAALPAYATGANQCAWCPAVPAGGGSAGGGSCVQTCPSGWYSLGGPTACTPLPSGLSFLHWDTFAVLVPRTHSDTISSSSGTSTASSRLATLSAKLSDRSTISAITIVVVCGALAIAVALGAPADFLRAFDAFGCDLWRGRHVGQDSNAVTVPSVFAALQSPQFRR